jgi:flagellar basal-body rod protein FlgC
MSVGTIFAIASSGLDAQSERITLIAQNLANANSTVSASGGPYQRRIPVFLATPVSADGDSGLGVSLAAVIRDQSPPRAVYDPSNPLAGPSGIVQEPNINPIYEMVDLMEASRAYEANLSVIQTTANAAVKTIDLLK